MRARITLTGMTPLVMHNPRLADPLDPIVIEMKSITKKKSGKTDVELRKLEELEFLGGLHYDKEVGPFAPSYAVLRCMENAAKITRKGTALIRALSPVSDKLPLIYDGPRDPQKLWEKTEFRFRTQVKNKQSTIFRMRPMFRKWSLVFDGEFLEDAGMDKSEVVEIAEIAGRSVGLLDARKLGYGRFTVKVDFNGSVSA